MSTLAFLVGGLGTRLRSVVRDVPKPMALIDGLPFLEHLLRGWIGTDLAPEQLILSVGYKEHVIKDYFGESFYDIPILYLSEKTPLGTGGAIKGIARATTTDELIVVNGDTWFLPPASWPRAQRSQKVIEILLKKVGDPDRYGVIELDAASRIKSIETKYNSGSGLVNGGVYWLNKGLISELAKSSKDCKESFEEDTLPALIRSDSIDVYGYIGSNDFLDIGVPEDYQRAASFLAKQRFSYERGVH